jgi:enoyl-CoA hydratase
MAGGPVLVARPGGPGGAVATVTLNRPDRLNALDLAGWNALARAFDALSADLSLRCVVVRGAGGKAFSAGADISAFARERADARAAKSYAEAVQRALRAVAEGTHPVVAMIAGSCLGGGLELASVCDIRIAGESSRFGVPVKKLGITMAFGELKALYDLVGPAAAREILLEGQIFGAGRALQMGLVNRVAPDGKVEEEAYACARRICDGAPLVARWHRKFIRRLADPRPLTQAEIDESCAAMDTQDYREGFAAFLAKRPPRFTGR